MNQDDIDYLRRRADEEEAAAITCSDPVAAQIHRNLAALYARKIDEFGQAFATEMPAQRLIRSR